MEEEVKEGEVGGGREEGVREEVEEEEEITRAYRIRWP